MLKLDLRGFKDPARRAPLVAWAAVALLILVAVVAVALGATSTRWFCAEGCHKVQDDTILAYQRSSHSEISCMACHMPVGADPFTFVLHKVETLGELYQTVTDSYELPLNPESELALDSRKMSSEQCTQCHDLSKRPVTPSGGIIIDHAVHEKKDVWCTECHNRVAHREDFEPTLKDPKSGKPNRKHEDFMKMEACFRCHGLESGAKAPGECAKCHSTDFELKPGNHLVPGFYTRGGESAGHPKLKKSRPDYCRMCHVEKRFCDGCHGLAMPHPEGFQKGHGALGKKQPRVCANCHGGGPMTSGTQFCNNCHHPQGDARFPWIRQHFYYVRIDGAGPCFKCHKSTYCAECHVRGLAGR